MSFRVLAAFVKSALRTGNVEKVNVVGLELFTTGGTLDPNSGYSRFTTRMKRLT